MYGAISSDGKTEKDIAVEGLLRMEEWMRDLGLAMNITACGADVSQLEGMADACPHQRKRLCHPHP